MSVKQIQEEIVRLKKQTETIILAHYYQPIEIQEIADHLGDSLGLSRLANEVNSEYIIFAGVDFMAETASILNQDKHVLIPNPESCCPMAAYLTAEKVRAFKQQNPTLPVVVYVNTTAAVKAESDICCTSSNAIKIRCDIFPPNLLWYFRLVCHFIKHIMRILPKFTSLSLNSIIPSNLFFS